MLNWQVENNERFENGNNNHFFENVGIHDNENNESESKDSFERNKNESNESESIEENNLSDSRSNKDQIFYKENNVLVTNLNQLFKNIKNKSDNYLYTKNDDLFFDKFDYNIN